jgi:hypothetical protein
MIKIGMMKIFETSKHGLAEHVRLSLIAVHHGCRQ